MSKMRTPRPPASLALRLTLLFSIVTAIVFISFGWIISRAVERHFEEGDAAEMQIIIGAVEAALFQETALVSESHYLRTRLDDILVGHHHASLYVVNEEGQPLYASSEPDLSGLEKQGQNEPGSDMLSTWQMDGHQYRVLIRNASITNATGVERYSIVVAVPIEYHLRFLAAFRVTLWSMVIGCVAISGLLGWVLVRRGHAPLRDIVTRVRRISADRLNTRLPPETVPYELRDLAVSFNEMLERVDASFQRLSEFNADIAHELRTPVTNLMTQTQVALSRSRTVHEYREVLYSNMEEYERMAQMVGDMLYLAQTDNRLKMENIETVHLEGEIRALLEYYEGWAEEQGVTLALVGCASVSADRLMLRRAFGNLLSNAIRHTPPGGTVRVILTAGKTQAEIVVENPGPPIPPEHLGKIFNRFYRVDPSRERGRHGAGLGLAIVKSIVTAHRGEVSANSTEACTRFSITLPIHATTPSR